MHIPRHQKTYLSRAMTRAMSAEHPIGDPHGGPAYGERNEPVSAIISIGTMLFTGAEVIAGTATLMQGLTFAGAALSLVGNVTGNSTLSKLGMITGLAGGVGMLAESAGLFSSATMGDTFGYGSGATPTPGAPGAQLSETAPTSAPAGDVVQQAVQGPSMVPDAAPQAPQGGFNVDQALNNSASNLTNSSSQGLVNNAMSGPNASTLANTSAPSSSLLTNTSAPATLDLTGAPATPNVAAPATPGAPTATSFDSFGNPVAAGSPAAVSADPTGLAQMQLDANVAARPPGFLDSIKSGNFMDALKTGGKDLMDLAKTNPGAAYMLGMGLSSAADVLSGKTGAQIDALQAQGQLSRAQADNLRYQVELSKKRTENLNNHYTNVPNPLASWKPSFQTLPVGQQPGLISGAQQPAKA